MTVSGTLDRANSPVVIFVVTIRHRIGAMELLEVQPERVEKG